MTDFLLTILQDRREQRPLPIREHPVQVVTLGTGDYGIRGFSGPENPCFILERKSLDDLANSLGCQRARFWRECERMRGYRFRGILIEGTREQVERHDYRSEIFPQSILASLDALVVRCNIHVFWCGSPDGAARQLESLVRQFARGIVKNYQRIMAACATPPPTTTCSIGGKTTYAPATDPDGQTPDPAREAATTGRYLSS